MARNGKRGGVSQQALIQAAAVQAHPAHGNNHRRPGRPTKVEAAGKWGLEQFEAPRIHSALSGFGVEELVKSYVAIARDVSCDDKGRPVVATTARLRALEKLRELHHDLAATESTVSERVRADEDPKHDDDGDDGLDFLR